jgi:hypothetical protein
MATYSEISTLILNLLPTGQQISASNHRTVEQALLDFAESQWLTGDVKEIDCTNSYITDNFESNGLGKNERLGWAICNGQNGTRNRTGRVSVGYGLTSIGSAPTFPSIGTTLDNPIIGGSKDAVVVSHSHDLREDLNAVNQSGTPIQGASVPIPRVVPGNWRTSDGSGDPASGAAPNTQLSVISAGSTGTDKNMQPYIVTLFIQKL